MKINLVTLFPEFFNSPLSCGLMQKAVGSGLVKFNFYNPRDYTADKRQTVDDRPYGGGPGMVMLLEPLARALSAIEAMYASPPLQSEKTSRRLLCMSPGGRPFNQDLARELAREDELTVICGRYEGIDARLMELFPIETISMGDFVLNGGETAALALSEAVCRLLPGFMGHEESALEESFSAGLLEYPHYTRPEEYAGIKVPEVLKSGDHARIDRWRRDESILATLHSRPELLQKAVLNKDDMALVRSKNRVSAGKNLYMALVHYPVLDKEQKSVSVSVTNLDIHDISRVARTYGMGAFFMLTPLSDQRLIANEVLEYWVRGPGALSNPDRKDALSGTMVVENIDEAISFIERKHGSAPLLWASSAQGAGGISFSEVGNSLYKRPALLLLGTSHGLAPEITDRCSAFLPPLRWAAPYNHLSVRCAAAILLDRLLGDMG